MATVVAWLAAGFFLAHAIFTDFLITSEKASKPMASYLSFGYWLASFAFAYLALI